MYSCPSFNVPICSQNITPYVSIHTHFNLRYRFSMRVSLVIEFPIIVPCCNWENTGAPDVYFFRLMIINFKLWQHIPSAANILCLSNAFTSLPWGTPDALQSTNAASKWLLECCVNFTRIPLISSVACLNCPDGIPGIWRAEISRHVERRTVNCNPITTRRFNPIN